MAQELQHCSPKNKNKNITCFSIGSLVKIAKAYNKQFEDKIDLSSYNFNISRKRKKKKHSSIDHNEKNRIKLWKEIQSKFSNFIPCNKDYCIFKNSKVRDMPIKELEKDFRPEMPEKWLENPKEWLSTVDILKVMEQYVVANDDFAFMGPVPIDFDHEFSFGRCVSNELCKINLEKLYNRGIRRIGVIFNLDPHYKGGSHWVCLFVDVRKGGIYFIDSTGASPPKEVNKLMARLQRQGNRLLINKKILPTDLEKTHTINIDISPIDRRTVEMRNIPKNLVINEGTPCIFTDKELTTQSKFNKVLKIDGNKITMSADIGDDFKKCLIHSFKSFYNKSRFQYKNTECGIYSMFFLEEFLKGKTFDQIVAKTIHDAEINQKRSVYYRDFVDELIADDLDQ